MSIPTGAAAGSGPIRREYPQRPIPSAHVLIFREGRVLLVKRAHEPSRGLWSVPGGAIELGETLREAARREVREECGVEVKIGRVLDVADSILLDESGRVRFHYVLIYLLARYAGGEARPSSDAAEVRWVARQELSALPMHPLARRVVEGAFEIACPSAR